jgi:hypothetical protein
MDSATARTRIDAIDEILASGVQSVTHNGRTLTYDLAALRRERDRLQAYLNRGSGGRNVRVGRYNTAYSE